MAYFGSGRPEISAFGQLNRTQRPEEFPAQNVKRRKIISQKMPANDSFSHNRIPTLPNEIWLHIIDNIDVRDTGTLSSLSRASKAFYETISPILHRSIVAAAPSESNLRGFIRLLERYLSAGQCKALKAEHVSKTQRQQNPGRVNDHFVPYCSKYVSRMTVGWSQPDQDHMSILSRYLEEVLGNISNLEALVWLDTRIPFSESIGNRISRLENLKALVFNFCTTQDISVLQNIKNLKFFDAYIRNERDVRNQPIIEDILWGSQDTLETFIYDDGDDGPGDVSEVVSSFQKSGKLITFPNITTLCIRPRRMDDIRASWFLYAINFERLTYLEFSTLDQSPDSKASPQVSQKDTNFTHEAFFRAMISKHGTGVSSSRLALKTFRFRAKRSVQPDPNLLALLQSFDTLQQFVYEETSYAASDQGETPVDAIISSLKWHKGLRWLSIQAPSHRSQRWKFTKEQLETVRDCFPNLSHLACLFSWENKNEFLDVLPTFENLRSFHMPLANWFSWTGISHEQNQSPIELILIPFLQRLARNSPSTGSENWEDRYKLSLVVTGGTAYEISSSFPKTMNKSAIPSECCIDGESIQYRRVVGRDLWSPTYPNLNFMRPEEWRSRNYDSSDGDWFQGIKF